MVTRLNPPIWLKTPKGKALAMFLIDYGFDHDLQWVTFIRDNGQCWTFNNPQIRLDDNQTAGIKSEVND